MSLTIDMSTQEIAALKRLTRLDNDADAVAQAAREYLRLGLLGELKAASGKVDLDIEMATPLPESLTVGRLNHFLRGLPSLGDDAKDFATDVRAIRAQFPAEANPWD